MSNATAIAVAFVDRLRSTGVDAPLSATIEYQRALGALGMGSRDAVYWAGRTTLVRRREDIAAYDTAFNTFWDDHSVAPYEPPSVAMSIAVDDGESPDDDDGGLDGHETDEAPSIELRFSAAEVLRHRDFATYSDDELAEARRLMGRLRVTGSPRRSLRLVNGHGSRPRMDLRRTVRAALSTGGEPLQRHWRHRGMRPRRLVLLLDVSGSMEPYARALVRFAHAAVIGRQRVEVFALGTRLTRMTRELSERNPDAAVARAARAVVDWSGGTRLGDGLREFNQRWGQRGMARGATVVILSDGWDRGDPTVLEEQMLRLRRLAHRVIWVNPLKVTPGYAPLARGMATALPHLDAFVEGHSIDAMERLAAEISR